MKLPPAGEPFVLDYTPEAWREVEGKLEPFTSDSSGYNWRTMEGDVRLLISLHGDE